MNPIETADDAPWQDLVRQHAAALAEHCDTVQIFVSKQMDGGDRTRTFEHGLGNIFARQGHVREWVLIQDEFALEWARDHASSDEEP